VSTVYQGKFTIYIGGVAITDNATIDSMRVAIKIEKSMGHPQCAVCGKPVEHLAGYDDMTRQTTVFVARCHGEEEEIEVTKSEALDERFTLNGEAFKRHKLDRGKRRPRLPEPRSDQPGRQDATGAVVGRRS
jgi:hypothetical protein